MKRFNTYFCRGEMAERSNAAVLKTVDCHRSGGSNPSLSAHYQCKILSINVLHFLFWHLLVAKTTSSPRFLQNYFFPALLALMLNYTAHY